MNKISEKITKISLFSILLVLTFCSPNNFFYPTFNLDVLWQGVLLFFCIFINLIFNRTIHGNVFRLRLDLISIFLLIRVIYFTFSIFLIDGSVQYLSYYISIIFSFLVYLWMINKKIKENDILRFCECFIVIIGVQTIIAVLTSNIGQNLYLLKSQIVIPLGASNYITCFFILFFPIIYKLERNKIVKYIFLILSIVIIFLSRSTSGFIVFVILMIVLLLSEKQYKVLKILLMLLLFVGVIYFIGIKNSEYLERLINNISSLFNGMDTTNVLNGREILYQECIDLIKESPIFGHGFAYRNKISGNLMTHNWILEMTVSGGIIGLFLFAFPIYIFLKKTYKYRKNLTLLQISIFISIFCVLIQGFVEPSLSTMKFDIIFWLLIGLFNQKNYFK